MDDFCRDQNQQARAEVSMIRSPSVKALRQLFGADAPKAKALLLMTRAQLLQTPVGAARLAEC